MAGVPQFRAIMSILTKGKAWHIPLNNLLSHTKRYLEESHQNLAKKIVKMTLFVRDVAIYWLNASQKPRKETIRGNRNQKLVDLNQDLSHTHTRFN